jgi:hypothetical protein
VEIDMAGKGSNPRPYSVDHKTFENNWDKIFNKKEKENESKSHTSAHTERSSEPKKPNQ